MPQSEALNKQCRTVCTGLAEVNALLMTAKLAATCQEEIDLGSEPIPYWPSVFAAIILRVQEVEDAFHEVEYFMDHRHEHPSSEKEITEAKPGDLIVDLIFPLVLHAMNPQETEDWQYQATKIGKKLLKYSKSHVELQLAVAPWVAFIRKHGGDARLVQHENGEQEITWHGSLAKVEAA